MSINKHSLEKTGNVAVEGGEISYRLYEPHDKVAANRTPLIVLHGGPGGSHAAMYDSLNSLADDRSVIFYDQLGSHFSPAEMTPDLMRVDRFAEEVTSLINALSLDKAILLGHSCGGAVATEFTLSHPEKVAGLILSAPLLSTQRWVDDCNILLSELPPDMQDTIRICEENGMTNSEEYKAANKFFCKQHYCRTENPPAFMEKHREKMNWSLYNAMWGPSEFSCHGNLKDVDYFPRLHEIEMPVLLVCGEYDTATPVTMRDAQERIKHATLKIIPNSGHAIHVDGNESYLAAISAFLSKEIDMKPVYDLPPRGLHMR